MPEVLPAFNSHHDAGGRKGCGWLGLPSPLHQHLRCDGSCHSGEEESAKTLWIKHISAAGEFIQACLGLETAGKKSWVLTKKFC